MPRTAFAATILCAMCALACASAKTGDGARVHKEGAYFEAALPPGWVPQAQYLGLSQDEKKVYGITLEGPSTGTYVTPVIAAHYYGPGNLMDETPEDFIRSHSSRAAGGSDAVSGAGSNGGRKVGGLPAKRFEKTSYQRGPGSPLKALKIKVREGFAVIPLKQGYYVLRYSAAADTYEAGLPVFEAFVSSFKPLLK